MTPSSLLTLGLFSGLVAASFTPFLQSRQSVDDASCSDLGGQECGSSGTCIPLDYKCCPDNAGGCPADGWDCWLGTNNQYGCCPVDETCEGPGGVDEIGITSTFADVSTDAGISPTLDTSDLFDITSTAEQTVPTTDSLEEDFSATTDLSDATTPTSRQRTTFETEATPTRSTRTAHDLVPTSASEAGDDDEDSAAAPRSSWIILGAALVGAGALLL